jgi:hypothetical protein
MRYFVDTEFVERSFREPIELVSIAIVVEDGRELYLVNADFDPARASPWVAEHVLPRLPPRTDPRWRPRLAIRAAVRALTSADSAPEFWAYCAGYDWVLLCQLFNTMSERPEGWPKYCRDVRQEADRLGINLRDVLASENEHDALADARWCYAAWAYLTSRSAGPGPGG